MDNDSDFDLDDDELDSLYEKVINKRVSDTLVRHSLPVQRDLERRVLPGEQAYYEEIRTEVTFGPTHHALNEDELGTYIYPTNYEIRDYQFDIVRKGLEQNILCAIPTGMGKTFIASTVMLNFFRWTQTAKIIFTAPTRPLVAQQIKACLGITGIPHDQTAILLDKSRKNREDIWREKRVFFTTPQVVENDLKRGVLNPKDIACLVIDEAHRATGSYAYSNLVKFIDRFNSSYRLLALTATPGTDLEGVQEVVNNLNISKIEIRTEESLDIAKYMKKREKDRVNIGTTSEIEDIVEQLGIAILPVLNQAVELGIYEACPPSCINSFKAMQKSQSIIMDPSIPEGIKWRNYFILQLLNHVGQMLKRIKIYGIRTFYSYFQNKYKEFTTKYNLGKSTNKIAAGFYYNPLLQNIINECDEKTKDPHFLGHGKLEHLRDELIQFFNDNPYKSRVIIFTELRESALEIVKCVDSLDNSDIRPHIFIGQAKGKEGFDEVKFTKKHQPKGRKKADREKRLEEERLMEEQKKQIAEQEKLERSSRRTATSEEAQISGMNQKKQKEVIKKFKEGTYNVLVCTSIGEEGLDIGEVDLIICYDTTSSPIKNIQRMGRTGRKRDGRIVLMFSSNESSKFDQSMEGYYNLQKLISQHLISYKKSDRILPAHITDIKCEKKFIEVSESDKQLNNMEDVDDVIKYATQCMLGKVPKNKKNSKTKNIKNFFMPDNVITGIITANNLVRKRVAKANSDKNLLETIEDDPIDLEEPTDILDVDQELNKLNSTALQPVVVTNERGGSEQIRHRDEELRSEDHLPVKNEPIDHPPVLSQVLATPETLGEQEYAKTVKTEEQEIVVDDEDDLPLSRQLGGFVSSTQSPQPIFEEDVSLSSFGQRNPPNQDLEPPKKKLKPSTPSRKRKNKLYTNKFTGNMGFLTPSEKKVFVSKYNVDDASVAIEPMPMFHQTVHIDRHVKRTQELISLFNDLNKDNKPRIIAMNKIRCLARRHATSTPSQERTDLTNSDVEDLLNSDF
ncbi:ATP-dependent DNA helicase MPH1 [Nakaseomyces bracarensis]|uniref:ATP-dependent DNA helicase n=1 Tax=Nakaseomyces bracarensis TaxID=273131 RepID=A0ABR4NWC1_9SACH